jgi:uncharacterized Zn-finger protein
MSDDAPSGRGKRPHTGERPHKCDSCDAAFTRSANLWRHKKATHTGERPFKCDSCDAAFMRSAHLKTHMFTHTGERPFKSHTGLGRSRLGGNHGVMSLCSVELLER